MMKKISLCLVLAVFCAALPVFAGGKKQASQGRVVTTVCRSSYANELWYKDMNAAFTAATGIVVQVEPTPGNDDDHNHKVDVDLLAGGTIDVIPTLGPRDQQGRIDAGFFMPLNDRFKQANVNVEGIWGKYADYQADGTIYGVPIKQEIFCVYYNKDMFDRAGVPYPQGPWTWEDYFATARKITDLSKEQYGSFMNADTPWMFMTAKQRGIPFYKADGTSNFDDPGFAESLRWYYNLSHSDRIQMSVSQILADNASWNYYALKDNLAMFPQGNWFMRLLNSQADYPKDWKYGVTQMPGGDRNGNKTFVSMGYVSVNKNAAHPAEALEYLVWLGQNQWRYEGGIPALASLSAADQQKVFEATAGASSGQITVQDLYRSLMDNGMGIEQSDIVGPAATEYNAIVREEAERYNLDQQDLATTVRRIVSRANEAIANAK
jgi:multiple sugar transport system substrate-binding protein